MILNYTTDIVDDIAILKDDEYRHAIKTLRKKVGDPLSFVDGAGYRYEASIKSVSKKEVELSIVSKTHSPQIERMSIAISPTKSPSRFEWFLEKATEIGIAEIHPMLCSRTEKKKLNEQRCRKIIISAMKQSMRARLPALHPLRTFAEVLEVSTANKFLAHYQPQNGQLKEALLSSDGDFLSMIGPEGDFTTDEIALAKASGFTMVNISDHRLRTETAGLVCCLTAKLII